MLEPAKNNIEGLLDFVFEEREWENTEWLVGWAVRAPKNNHLKEIDENMIHRFPGDVIKYARSSESVVCEGSEDDEFSKFPLLLLHTITPSGLPDDMLILKIGMPMILLRNMNGNDGQVNGTPLILRRIMTIVLDVEIASGTHIGKRVLLPKIQITASESRLLFKFQRLQFPLKPSFDITIEQSKGQTYNKI